MKCEVTLRRNVQAVEVDAGGKSGLRMTGLGG